MSSQAQMNATLEKHVQGALGDFQNFVVSEMIHAFIDAAPDGTLERLIATWRLQLEARWAEAARARMQQTGLIQATGDAEKLILDLAADTIRSLFSDEPESPDPRLKGSMQIEDDQPTLM